MADMQQPQSQMMYNPYMSYQPYQPTPTNMNSQQRLQYMEQQYPHLIPQQQQQQQMMQQQMQQSQVPALKGRAVTGLEEAKASAIDFDGSVHYFTDVANGHIYTKQIGLNGAAEFNTYKLVPKEITAPIPQTDVAAAVSISKEDFDALQKRIMGLENKINNYEEMFLNDKSTTSNGNATKQWESNANVTNDGGKQSGDGTSTKNGPVW